MASNFIIVKPTGGSGNASASIGVSSTNNNYKDRVCNVVVSDGATSKTIVATQYGQPALIGPTDIVSYEGADLTFTLYSHYKIVFNGIPSWITVKNGSTTLSEGVTYNLPHLTELTLTVNENATGAERISEGFYMYHYRNNTKVSTPYSLNIVQSSDSAEVSVTPESITFGPLKDESKTAQITANESYTITVNDN